MNPRERLDAEFAAPQESGASAAVRGEARAAPPQLPRRRRAGRFFGVLFVVLVLAVLATGFMLPGLARIHAERWLSAELARPVSIARLHFDPLSLVADLEALRIGKRDGDGVLLSVDRARIDFAWTTMRRRGPVIERLQVERPVLALERRRDGSLDVGDLVRRWREPDPEHPLPGWLGRFSIANIEIDDGAILLDDEAVGQKHRVEELSLKIPFVSSLPVHGSIDVEPSLSALVNGARFVAEGQAQPFGEERRSTLTVDLGTSDVRRYVDYLPVAMPWRVVSAQAAARVSLDFLQPEGGTPRLHVSGALTLAGVELAQADGQPLLSLPAGSVELLEYDPQAARLRIGSVLLSAPRLAWRRATTPVAAPGTGPASPLAWSVERVEVIDGSAQVDAALRDGDRLAFAATEVAASVTDLSSDEVAAPGFSVSARFGRDETAEIDGRFSLHPLLLSGRFDVRGMRLRPWLPVLPETLRPPVRAGALDMAGGFEWGERDAAVAPAAGEAEVPLQLLAWKSRLAGLKFDSALGGVATRPQGIGVLAADGLSIDFSARRIGFTSAQASDLSLAIVRETGTPLGLDALDPWLADAEAGGARLAPDGWQLEPGALALRNALVRIEESSRGRDTQELRVANLALGPRDEGGAVPVTVSARLDDGATIAATGHLGPAAGRLALALDAKGLELARWRATFGPLPGLGRVDGTLGAQGELSVGPGTADGPAELSWNGLLSIAGLRVASAEGATRIFDARLLRATPLQVETRSGRLEAGEVELEGPRVRLHVSPQGELALAALSDDGPGVAGPATASADAGLPAPADIRLAGLRVSGGSLVIRDARTARGASTLELKDLAGTLAGVAPDTPGELTLAGRVGGGGSFRARGRANVVAPRERVELDLSIGDLPLATVSPWVEPGIGQPVTGGRADGRLSWQVRDGQLELRPELRLRDLAFGPRPADAPGEPLPLALALALLGDAQGRLDLAVPVTGSLDDRGFAVGTALGQGLASILAQAGRAPFERLAGLVGAAAGDLERVRFEAGVATLDDTARAGLALLARALRERPALRLDITGLADGRSDRDALAQGQFERMLKARKLQGQGSRGGNLDAVTIGRGEYPLLVDALFEEARLPVPAGRDGRPREPTVTEKTKALIATLPVGDSQLLELADARAEAVRGWLVGQGGVDAARVARARARIERDATGGPAMRAELGLEAGTAALARARESS